MCVRARLPAALYCEQENSLAASRQSGQLFSLFESDASVMNCLQVEEIVDGEKGGQRDRRSLSQRIRDPEMRVIPTMWTQNVS